MVSGIVVTAIDTVALMVAYPIYLHFLGFEKYGLWLVLATVLNLARLGQLGFDQAIMKLVAEEYSSSDTKSIQKYVTTSLALLFLSGTVALIVILILKNQIISAFKLNDVNAQIVSFLLPYVGILSIYIFIVEALNATLSGLGRMDLANYGRSVGRILAVIAATILLYSGRGIESLLIGNTLCFLFIHIASLICIRRIANVRFLRANNFDLESCKRILCFVGGIFGSTVLAILRDPFNKLMLSRYAGVSTLPVYEIVFRAASQIKSLFERGLVPLLPQISRLSGLSTGYAIESIRTVITKTMKLILFLAFPMYITLFIAADLLFKLWLRDKYVDTIPLAFRILLVASFLSLIACPSYYSIMGMGKIRHIFVANTIVVFGNFIGVFAFFFITGTVSVNAVCLVLGPSYLLAALYIILKTRSELRRRQDEHLPDSKQGEDSLLVNTDLTAAAEAVI
jgi:O-antigen/teichoic acid export membrane protein